MRAEGIWEGTRRLQPQRMMWRISSGHSYDPSRSTGCSLLYACFEGDCGWLQIGAVQVRRGPQA
eukprot:29209-Eustigmatos_ZCMA.PRE.1